MQGGEKGTQQESRARGRERESERVEERRRKSERQQFQSSVQCPQLTIHNERMIFRDPPPNSERPGLSTKGPIPVLGIPLLNGGFHKTVDQKLTPRAEQYIKA